ncbi:hypothetical protein EYF80_016553 [Liparis tanakae]|uniref:Uncharacterized protein n=1 Tax=Liparis tanakae TaxID=230148 RepID=A0A4Z2I7H0_9TELE|nr:hypothetical protein EYF80_016553 [Liparis tanakae]
MWEGFFGVQAKLNKPRDVTSGGLAVAGCRLDRLRSTSRGYVTAQRARPLLLASPSRMRSETLTGHRAH